MSISDAPKGIDRRAWRTRQLLAQALIELGAERDIDDLEISELVQAAGVGRSTFYTHYADRDDFLIGSFVNLIAAAETMLAEKYPQRTDLAPSRPLLHHIYQASEFARAIVRSRVFLRQMTAGEEKLRTIVEANLKRLKPAWGPKRRRETAVYVAAGLIGLLRWWMVTGVRQTPEQMQEAFERLSRSALQDEAG